MNDEILADLAEQFRAHTLERLDAMRTLLAHLEVDRANGELLTALHRHFHGLAGLGGTYGFSRVSDIAGEAEDACGSIVVAGTLDDAFIAMLEQAIVKLEAEVRGRGSDRL